MASENQHHYEVASIKYLDHRSSEDGRLIYENELVVLDELGLDLENNLNSWKKIHKDWKNEYQNQFEFHEKYLAKKKFLNQVIGEFELWFRTNRVKMPKLKRKEFEHTDEYRSINLHGKTLSLTIKDAFIIKILHEHAKRRTPELGFNSIVTSYDENFQVKYKNIKDMFSDDNIRKKLITNGRTKGTLKLNL